ncbi:uncharacterized protein LOC106163064 [Lingula anatina]|uniref:Uncharacterized protein LOC106163064 n=1 Tax=Lingula anatina TaxID=7574 RepID=A0A1S3ICU6_LINAN|nr:uncharacterized protein LOC106163064 [Lingula anatina]|eukprot:XP_013395988.1 uncharacterized protein LOC106163064 [Lingula anatina]
MRNRPITHENCCACGVCPGCREGPGGRGELIKIKHTTVPVSGYKLTIRVSDEERKEEWVYENNFPYFETPNHGRNMHTSTLKSGLLFGGHPSHFIAKRDVMSHKEDNGYCLDRISISKELHSSPLQKAIIVELGMEAKMLCHFCDESTQRAESPRVWHRVVSAEPWDMKSRSLKTEEVEIDAHDDETANRVVVTPEHSLIIKRMERADAGTYYCETFTEKFNDDIQMSPDDNGESLHIKGYKVKAVYHLDYFAENKNNIQIVSREKDVFSLPNIPIVNITGNYVTFTSWAKWSECSTCGRHGERKRIGICKVKISVPEKSVFPKFLGHILRLYSDGAPCHSSMFSELPDIFDRQDEMEWGRCTLPCRKSVAKRQTHEIKHKRSFYGDNFKYKEREQKESGEETEVNVKEVKTSHSIQEEKITQDIDTELLLACPGASMLNMVWWVNGSRYIPVLEVQNRTEGRVEITVLNQLVIHKLNGYDTLNPFTCYVEQREKKKFIIKDFVENLKQIGITFCLNFLLFILVLIIKHKQRMSQPTK